MGALESILTSPLGRRAAARAGLAEPPVLRRGRVLPEGPVLLADLPGGGVARATLAALGLPVAEPLLDLPENRAADERGRPQPPRYELRPGALVIDATGIREVAQLELLRQVLRPVMKRLADSGRVILLATDAATVDGVEARAVAQAMDGLMRTVGKELRGGATANLLWLAGGVGADDVGSTLAFLLEGRSAFVSGQAWRIRPRKPGDRAAPSGPAGASARPFEGRIVVVTGAARGIGAAIARTFRRDGAEIVAVDMPAAGESLAAVANGLRGSALQLDITVPDAGARIAAHVARVHGSDAKIWAIVHNAGITRDTMLANLDERRWASVLDVNLAAEMRINATLVDAALAGGLAENARIVGIASTSGWAGNKGQANYAASKAGVMGLVRAEADALAGRPITANAVAPGFIETDMTAAIPFVQREIFRRTNSLAQGGQPVDVAETLAYLCDPASGGVDGQVIRVCGQNIIGA
ncbi:MAG: 3-oxoacyl-ACP reductase [Nigerium sp.]|nr:3-oxoacyl-ACP reductase [Nigerium sp.]